MRQVEAETGSIGLNAATGELEDLVKAGVIDPAKVTRAALQNAASIAALVLTTECLVADKPEKAGHAGHAGRRRHGRHGRHGNDVIPDADPTLISRGTGPAAGRPGPFRVADWLQCGASQLRSDPPDRRVRARLGLIAQAVQGSQASRSRAARGRHPRLGGRDGRARGRLEGRVAARSTAWSTSRWPSWRCSSAFLPWTNADLASRAVLVVTAALLGLLILRSDYTPKVVAASRGTGVTWPRTSDVPRDGWSAAASRPTGTDEPGQPG